ncbi:hypothetical protein CVT30_32270 [Streptomyces sp. AMCC400023]|nr:hypothetical protein CVT30_32270 [Streptomyces sp. AMCC400023]
MGGGTGPGGPAAGDDRSLDSSPPPPLPIPSPGATPLRPPRSVVGRWFGGASRAVPRAPKRGAGNCANGVRGGAPSP